MPAKNKEADEAAVTAAIAAMPEPYCVLGERLHAIITANAPNLAPKDSESRLRWISLPHSAHCV